MPICVVRPRRKYPGLSEFALGLEALEDLTRNPLPNLHVLTTGTKVPNPAELLSNSWLTDLIEEALGQFDQVVVDSAPLNAVGDTLLLVRHIPNVCLVIRSGKTPRQAIRHALDNLELAKIKPIGLILNRLPVDGGTGYFFHYGEKGGYGSQGIYGAKA
jgi:polysaccharide biosynthesis transport protein